MAKIEQELKKGDYSPTTVKSTLTTVQGVFNRAIRQDLLDSNPLTGYQKPRARCRTRVVTKNEFNALLRASDRSFRRFLIALRLTGCRPGELRTLIWEWVDLDQGLWIIPEHKSITNLRNRPYTKDCLVTKMDSVRERAGIEVKGGEQIVLYSQRHSFGSESVGKVSDIELAELMGHTEPRMTQRYIHLNIAHLKDIQKRAAGNH